MNNYNNPVYDPNVEARSFSNPNYLQTEPHSSLYDDVSAYENAGDYIYNEEGDSEVFYEDKEIETETDSNSFDEYIDVENISPTETSTNL
jgi:hypothetical protein